MQLHFPINPLMCAFPKYKLPNNFEEHKAYKSIEIIFPANLGKNEEVWFVKKIVKILSITKEFLFDNLEQSYCYKVLRAGNKECDYITIDFPLMNEIDFIIPIPILAKLDKS